MSVIPQLLDLVSSKIKLPKILIETGTHQGWSTKIFAEYFDIVHTIEIKEELIISAKEYCKDRNNIIFHCGSSPNVLKELLPTINEKYIIFLDAHHSGGDTGLDIKYGSHGTPLSDEFSIIKQYSKRNDNIIMIDDCNLLGSITNYPSTEEVLSTLKTINSKYIIDFLSIGTLIGLAHAE